MFATFLQASGFAFWIVLAVIVIVNVGLLSRNDSNDGWPVFIAAAGFLGLVLFSDAFVGFRVVSLIGGLAAYLALGVMWAMWKWYGFLVLAKTTLRAKYDAAKDPELGPWLEYAAKNRSLATYNKQRLINWMALWPFSFSWWVLTWPRRAFVWLYERLSTVFDRMSARVFAS